ncbi:6954_t:CDS:1 [Cetraspora pellucida]|uniref:6954_t:CDS:1 n=1 Tax=Cetraspora pellucida TaxID=1433469 RepID=A0ACA9JZJ0_9GLOM|nr:6954_t:CDS:1 [Cetraspora pellucida]
MSATKNIPGVHKFFHQFEGIATLRDDKYISEWNKYTDKLTKTPNDPNLWCQRALACLKEGYPEIALIDAKRVLLLCDEIKDNIELQKISYEGRYYYAEALRALGLPGMSASEYEMLKDLSESFDKTKKEKFQILALKLRQLSNIRIQVSPDGTAEPKNDLLLKEISIKRGFTSPIMLSYVDCGWFKFVGQYPWDKRPNERISATILKDLQNQLDNASNKKLKVVLRKLPPDLVKESKMTIHLGVESIKDFTTHEIILEEDPFIAGHNHFSNRCEYCTLELVEKPGHPRCSVKYPCHNSRCKELFCNKKCYKLAMKLYHKRLCGKSIDTIIRSARRVRPGWNHIFILVLKLFALAKERDINPLDIKEIKHLSRQHANSYYEGHLPWDSEYEIIYIEILKLTEISLYDLQYDFWVFITLMAILGVNVFSGEGNIRDTHGVFPLTSLFNHSCNPLVTHMNATERYFRKDLTQQFMELRQKYQQIDCNRFRFTTITLQNVMKGQEIFTCYVDTIDDKQQRQSRILYTYGFICHCDKCEADPQCYFSLPGAICWNLHYYNDNDESFLSQFKCLNLE